MKKNEVTFWRKFVGSTFFIGKIKGGGTWASIFAGLLLFFFLDWTSLYFFLIAFLVLVLGILLSLDIVDDPAWFTLDEITGTMVTFAFHNKDLSTLIIGLILFRLFDIFKIAPIKKLEHSKAGVVLDDVVAGMLASVFLFVLQSVKNL